MELRHLRYFACVAEALNFRAAAHTLHVSTPALSRQIRDLEAELGVRLLDRNTQGVRLTNAGRVFLPEVRAILAQVQRAAAWAREAGQGRRGELRVGTIGRRLAHYLPQCLAQFQNRYPELQVELVELDYAEQAEGLRRGAIDIGFMPGHVIASLGPGLRRQTVLSIPLFALLGRRHRLARHRRVALAELAQERLLFLGQNKASMSAEYARQLFAARGLAARDLAEVRGFPILLAMVAARQGVSLMGFEPNLSGTRDVVLRPLKEASPDLQLEFCAVYPSPGPQPKPPVEHFLAVLREVAAQSGRLP
jgi:DNA-binding transcriptional LysR family regulator